MEKWALHIINIHSVIELGRELFTYLYLYTEILNETSKMYKYPRKRISIHVDAAKRANSN